MVNAPGRPISLTGTVVTSAIQAENKAFDFRNFRIQELKP